MSGEALDPGACPARTDGTVIKFEIVSEDMSKTAVVKIMFAHGVLFCISYRIIDHRVVKVYVTTIFYYFALE